MKLLSVSEWLARYFDESSKPSERTIRRWITSGQVPARKVGGTWYIDEHRWLADDDVLVERVLSGS